LRRSGIPAFALVFLLILFWTSPILALDRNKNIDQYGHDQWDAQARLPGESVCEILLIPDGCLSWVEAGTGRVVYYDSLQAGEYLLRGVASNHYGVWNGTDASMGFTLLPHFYQTGWFYALCIPAILLSAFGGHRLYTRKLRLRAEELRRVVDEQTEDLRKRIAERMQAEAALERQRRFLRQVIDASPSLIFVKDKDGRFTLANQAVADLCGTPVELLLGRTHAEVLPHQEEDARSRRDDQLVQDSLLDKFIPEETLTDIQGRVHWLQTVKRPILSPDGKSTSVLSVAMDITERKVIEEALRESREFLDAIIENSRAMIHVKDVEGRYILINRRFEELFHMAKASIVGKTDYDLFPKAHAGIFRTMDLRVLETNKPVESEDLVPVDGRVLTCIAVRSPLCNGTGKPYAVCGISTDITEQKQLEEELRQAQKMEILGQFADGIAHDFNSILTANLGYSEMMMSRLNPSDQLFSMAKTIRDASLRAKELTRRLLTYSRTQLLEPRALQLNATVSGMAGILQHLVGESITFTRHLDPHLHVVKADPNEIEQVIVNLVANAIDAMPEGGTLTVSTSNVELKEDFFRHQETPNPGDWAVLEVSDTGCGMDAAVMAHMFDPFFTTKDPTKGSGLGLTMVYGIVQQAGGLIRVESEESKGTRFRIFLPKTKEKLRPELEVAIVPQEFRGTETILIVDDEGSMRQFLYESLAAIGYTILEAQDGFEALQVAESYTQRIDLLLTDIVMPGMDGWELAQHHIRLHPESKVLFVSACSGKPSDPCFTSDSRYSFLPKPFALDTLRGRVRALLDREPSVRKHAAAAGC
jgi:PAS domain S-box-containing protein